MDVPIAEADDEMRINYDEIVEDEQVPMDPEVAEIIEEGDAIMAEEEVPLGEEEADMKEWEEIAASEGIDGPLSAGVDGDDDVDVSIVEGDHSLADGTPSPNEIAPRPEHPGFAAPPSTIESQDGLQVSALGQSAAPGHVVNPVPFSSMPTLTSSVPSPSSPALTAIVAPQVPLAGTSDQSRLSTSANNDSSDAQSHAVEGLDASNVLAAQHQQSQDHTQSQDQSVETRGPDEVVVHQRQSQERDNHQKAVTQENEIVIRQRKNSTSGQPDHIEIDMDQTNKGALSNGRAPVKQINHVNVFRRGYDSASCTVSGGKLSRPDIRKQMLKEVDIRQIYADASDDETDDAEPAQGSGSQLLAPIVLLTFGNETYSLFGRSEEDGANTDFSAATVLFEDHKSHDLYYDQIESLLEALHDKLPQLHSREDELVLSFDDIGISLTEDSVYTREVCLYDFDRIHVGCGLTGRLHCHLETQPRFSTGFNALVEHISRSYAPEGTEDGELTAEEAEQVARLLEEPDEREIGEHGQEEGQNPEGDEENESNENNQENGREGNEEEALAEDEDEQIEEYIEGEEVEVGVGDETFEDGEWYEAREEDEAFEGEVEETAAEQNDDESANIYDEAENGEETGENQVDENETAATGETAVPQDSPGDAKEGQSLAQEPAREVTSSSSTPTLTTGQSVGDEVSQSGTTADSTPTIGYPTDKHEATSAEDLVIDYEETFEAASSHPSPRLEPEPSKTIIEREGPLSPKRSRDSVTDAADGDTDAPASGDSKRARLAESEATP